MIRRLTALLPLLVLLLAPPAHAQDEWAIYGPDNPDYVAPDAGPTIKAVRRLKQLIVDFEGTTVEMAGFCMLDPQRRHDVHLGTDPSGFTITWDEADDDVHCNHIILLVAEVAALKGMSIYADVVVAWCLAAQIVEDLKPHVDAMIATWRAERRDVEPYSDYWRRLRNNKAWNDMNSEQQGFFIWMEQIALQLIPYVIEY